MNNQQFEALQFFQYGLGMTSALMALLPLFFMTFGVIYVLNAVRGWRTGRREAMLGGQVFLGLMLTASLQIFLVGLTALLWRLLEGDTFDTAAKVGGGMILGGALGAVYPLLVYLARVRSASSGRVLRQGLGVNAVFTGMVFVIAVTISMTLWINDAEQSSLPVTLTAVYFIANVICSAPLLSRGESDQIAEFEPAPRNETA
jgi:hypothetical protein